MNKERPDAPPNIYKNGAVKGRKELGLNVGAAAEGDASELSALLCVDGKTPKMLWPALRQYQHNDCSGLLAGFDYNEIISILADEITKAHMAGQRDAGCEHAGYSNAQGYLRSLADT